MTRDEQEVNDNHHACSNLDKNRKNIEVQIDDTKTLTTEMHCFHISKMLTSNR